MWTYFDLVDEVQAIFLHYLLSLQVRVHSGLLQGRVCRGHLRLLGGVFTWQVAHLAHQRQPGVDVSAEPANPLRQRPKRVMTTAMLRWKRWRGNTHLPVRVSAGRFEVGNIGCHGGAGSQAGALTHFTEDATALIHDGAAPTLPLWQIKVSLNAEFMFLSCQSIILVSPVLRDIEGCVGLSWTVAVASRGRSQVMQRTACISLTVVQWEHSHGDRDGLEVNNKQR